MGSTTRRTKGTGRVRLLPSGRYQARIPYQGRLVSAPVTFDTKGDAQAWLTRSAKAIAKGTFIPPEKTKVVARNPATGTMTLKDYATRWLADRPLKERTRLDYQAMIDNKIGPGLGHLPLDQVTADLVRAWHSGLASTPTYQARAYSLLKTIMATAVDDDLIDKNPCRIKGGAQVERATETDIATPEQIKEIREAMPERLQAAVLLGVWGGLRLGEVLTVQRQDIDLDAGTVKVATTLVRAPGGVKVGTPKSHAGRRVVALPTEVLPMLADHLERFTGTKPTSWLFPASQSPSEPMSYSTMYKHWYKAREAAGRPDLRFHDLRHTGATWAAQHGASVAELMARFGHTTPSMAMRYQHAASDRDRVLADKLGGMVL